MSGPRDRSSVAKPRVYSGAADHEWTKGVVEPCCTAAETIGATLRPPISGTSDAPEPVALSMPPGVTAA